MGAATMTGDMANAPSVFTLRSATTEEDFAARKRRPPTGTSNVPISSLTASWSVACELQRPLSDGTLQVAAQGSK